MKKTDSEIIDLMGGTKAVAEICDLTLSAVSQWRTNGIPKAWMRLFVRMKPKLFKGQETA